MVQVLLLMQLDVVEEVPFITKLSFEQKGNECFRLSAVQPLDSLAFELIESRFDLFLDRELDPERGEYRHHERGNEITRPGKVSDRIAEKRSHDAHQRKANPEDLQHAPTRFAFAMLARQAMTLGHAISCSVKRSRPKKAPLCGKNLETGSGAGFAKWCLTAY